MSVFPDFDSLSGVGDIKLVIGAMLTIVLIVAVLMLIICAIIWATAASTGNPGLSSKGRTGVLVAVGAAALAGAGVAWINWLVSLGAQVQLI